MVGSIGLMDESCGQTASASSTANAAASSGAYAARAAARASSSSHTSLCTATLSKASSWTSAKMLEEVRLLWHLATD